MELNKEQTPAMFDQIAGTYDKLNHTLSFGFDIIWRKRFVKKLKKKQYNTIVDIASGTGDLLLELQKLHAKKYIAIDPAVKMLELATKKVPNAEFIVASAEDIPLLSASANLITVSFGIRNFANLNKAFLEFHRVLDKNGTVSIMEFALPKFFLFRWGFIIYLKAFLPITGKLISRNFKAYKYLSDSIIDFSKNNNIPEILKTAGFEKLIEQSLFFGSVRIYSGTK